MSMTDLIIVDCLSELILSIKNKVGFPDDINLITICCRLHRIETI